MLSTGYKYVHNQDHHLDVFLNHLINVAQLYCTDYCYMMLIAAIKQQLYAFELLVEGM